MSRQKLVTRPCNHRVLGGSLALLCLLVAAVIVPPQPLFAKDSLAETDLKWGVKMARRGLWSEAMFRFKEASEMEPNNAHILNNLAVSLEAVGMFDAALEAYQRALKIDSSSKDLRQNYARFVEFYQAFKGPEDSTAEVSPPRDPNADPALLESLPEGQPDSGQSDVGQSEDGGSGR